MKFEGAVGILDGFEAAALGSRGGGIDRKGGADGGEGGGAGFHPGFLDELAGVVLVALAPRFGDEDALDLFLAGEGAGFVVGFDFDDDAVGGFVRGGIGGGSGIVEPA